MKTTKPATKRIAYSAATKGLAKEARTLKTLLWQKVMKNLSPEMHETLLTYAMLEGVVDDILQDADPPLQRSHERLLELYQKANKLLTVASVEPPAEQPLGPDDPDYDYPLSFVQSIRDKADLALDDWLKRIDPNLHDLWNATDSLRMIEEAMDEGVAYCGQTLRGKHASVNVEFAWALKTAAKGIDIHEAATARIRERKASKN